MRSPACGSVSNAWTTNASFKFQTTKELLTRPQDSELHDQVQLLRV